MVEPQFYWIKNVSVAIQGYVTNVAPVWDANKMNRATTRTNWLQYSATASSRSRLIPRRAWGSMHAVRMNMMPTTT